MVLTPRKQRARQVFSACCSQTIALTFLPAIFCGFWGNATNFGYLPVTPTCTFGGLFWSTSGCTTQFSELFIGYAQGRVQYGSRAACAASSGSPVSYSVISANTGCNQGGIYASYYYACDDASSTLYACRNGDCTDCIVGSTRTFLLTSSLVLIPIPACLTCERCMQ
jgi:hypothetical protein